MAMQTNLEALIEAAKHLSEEERKKLVEALKPCSDSPQPRHITEMRGLGKDLWEEIDSQEYLNAERDSWDN
jgi:tripartite-type tricarboxylate transporter receptor subunit TctC